MAGFWVRGLTPIRSFGKLRDDTELGGYVTDISQSQLEGAPSRPDDWRDNRDWATKNSGYYGVNPYWM